MSNASVLFIHRSVGKNLLEDGQLADELTKAAKKDSLAIDFHEINNNIDKGVPGDDTKPEDYLAYFKTNSRNEDLVIIKSCYPNNAIRSDEQLEQLKAAYKSLVEAYLAKSPGKLLVMTTPPLRPGRTNSEEARRARELATWLSELKLNNRVKIFNFYNLLAEVDGKQPNTLKREYRRLAPWDNHPNKQASRHIAPILASEVVDFLRH